MMTQKNKHSEFVKILNIRSRNTDTEAHIYVCSDYKMFVPVSFLLEWSM